MDFNQLTLPQVISTGSYIIQISVLLIMLLYLFFAFLLTRRLKIMNLNFKTPYRTLFSFIAKIHFVATILVIILTFLTLRR